MRSQPGSRVGGGVIRSIGVARSIVTYHAIPFRQQCLRRLYAHFVRPGDLVFDIGAHAGNRVRALAALGCRVVAVEPQPVFAAVLRRLFRHASTIDVVESAVSDRTGRALLAVSDRTPTVSTLEMAWRDARRRDAGFAHVQWNRTIEVDTTTLDELIARFGHPAFLKIDVEGGEATVLRGLTVPVPALSFEYLMNALDQVADCVDRLDRLGPYEFNWVAGESSRLAQSRWLDAREILSLLAATTGRSHGDVYARLP